MANLMDTLAEQQSENGQKIQTIISNYKKDSESRKTSREYYVTRLQRLEDAWITFESVDNEIRAIPDVPVKHQYFTEDYYTAIQSLYEQWRTYFGMKIQGFDQSSEGKTTNTSSEGDNQKGPANKPSEKPPKHTTSSNMAVLSENQLPQVIQILRRQKRIMDNLRRILSVETTSFSAHSKQHYELKIKTINQQWSQIEECDHKLWELTEDPTEQGYDTEDFVSLQEEVDNCLVLLATKRDSLSAARMQSTQSSNMNSNTMLKLPKLILPKFGGDYLKWTQFHDLFSQMVHNQPMPNCQKLWYLKANLSGEAEKLIRHFTASEENYTAAWQTLKDRYNNRRLLVTALINKLLSQATHANDSPSAAAVKSLHDTTQECLLGLQNLNVSTANWDPLLLHILIKKVDRNTYALYEQSLSNPREIQSIKVFLSFLENRFQALETLGTKGKGDDHQRRINSARALVSVASSTSGRTSCVSCKGNHPLFACNKFLKLTPSSRLSFVRNHNLCLNCLKPGHSNSRCGLRGCTKCSKKHNTLIHLESSEKTEIPDGRSTKDVPLIDVPRTKADQPAIVAAITNQKPRGYVLLGTAIVKLMTDKGDTIDCRAILDSGSQVNIITERVVKQLKLTPSLDTITIHGIGSKKGKVQHRVTLRLESTINKFATRLEAFVLPRIISPQPTQSFDISTWGIPKNIRLADPNFNVTDSIDLLLGAEFYYQLLSVGQIKLADNLPVLQNTVLGWVLTGKIDKEKSSNVTCGICTEDEQIDQLVQRFWKLEEVAPAKDNFTQEERRCETHFTQTVRRNDSGRFIVSLPFREESVKLGESRSIALNRFFALEKRLAKDPNLRSQYVEFMAEYIKLGHMKEIDSDNIHLPHYFIPHHCVFKPGSSTTKLRVVFDASMKTSSQLSLNDILCVGPTVQSDLFSILLRFRLPRFVFTADIQKMYRQILLDAADQKYQLIFWRDDPRKPLRCYQLCTVTYGTRPAPYLATKCLQNLAQENSTKYPLGAQILKDDFYVDDCITGSNSLPTAIAMQKELTLILKGAGFLLRRWCANHAQLLQGVPPEDQEIDLDFENSTEERIKTLGLTWLPKSDQFRIKAVSNQGSRITKRVVTSDIAKLFDPLGMLAPVVVTAKIFSQQLWQLKIDRDAALPMELHTRWLNFRTTLSALNNVTFPRHVFARDIPRNTQIHVFSDASESAYGAAIYVRSINKEGNIIVRLLCAKSRIAPLQKQTLPRLELCAALLAAQLTHRVKEALKFEEVPTYFWSDSEIVLSWISSPSTSYQTFVANRIAAIQELSIATQWRHVRSKENPADVLSRGLEPDKLEMCHLWFYGPPFLHGNESIWPIPFQKKIDCQLERKRTVLPTTTTTDDVSSVIYMINHGGSFRKLQRIVAYMLRFVKNAKGPRSLRPDHRFTTCQELDEALYLIIRAIQEDEFKEEISQLKKEKEVNKKSILSSLSPFLDDKGIIRVGGRLEQSSLSYDAKHPVVLPYSDPLTKLLMQNIHKENLHSGPQALLADTRQRFWPIKGKSIARSIVQHCVTCARARPKMMSQIMGNLPPARVQPARPFVNFGVDFCGPVWVHYKVKGKRPHKAYIAVFCCFATKAVHLEIVSDLSTEAFIGALKRFMGRRGNCRNLYCDNATNFVGARNQLQELSDNIYSEAAKENIAATCNKRGIDFHFIPPRAPHFGGLWEAAVKSAKHLLLKITSAGSLTYEELETLMIEIEAILNSRPLTQMSNDPNDLTAITPGHFLVGEPLTATIDTHAKQLKTTLLTRWKLVSHMKHEFWRRWSREYLNELQYRLKWKESCQNTKPGTIVILQDDSLPVMKWPLGRIVQTHKGNDGLVRVADVKTATGILRRPIHKLSPLPCDEAEHDDTSTNNEIDTGEPSSGPSNQTTEPEHSSQRKRSVDKTEVPTKKRLRNSYGSAMVTLLLACLVLPPVFGASIDIEHFDAKPGIYFENIGKANFISTEWSLIVYYDLRPYWMEFAALSNGTNALNYLCQQIKQRSTCNPILEHFRHIEEELEADNTLLSSKRQKRGAIDIVGNVANALFGVLDSEYAKKMSETIDAINENEEHLLALLKNQTSIIHSTINIIKRDQIAAERKFKDLDNQITQLINRINHTGEETYELKMIQLFTSLSIQLSLIVSHLQRTQSSIVDVLTDIHHGRISPLLVTPQQLSHELIVIKNHLPPAVRLTADQNNILQIYKTMSAASGIVNNHVTIKIRIPLVTLESFDLYKMIPIPALADKVLVAIRPCATYIALSPHRDQHYSMSDHELSSCISTEGSSYICSLNHPIYHKGADICSCEVNLFHNSPYKKCYIQKIENSPAWIQLNDPNQWIFAVKETIIVNALCKEETIPLNLTGSGLLKMLPECVIKYDLLTIQGIHTYPSSARTSYKRLSELNQITTPERLNPVISNSIPYETQREQLEELMKTISTQLQEESLRKINSQNVHQFAIGYIALTLIVLLIGVLIFKARDLCNRKSKPPIPAPRQPKELDFTVNV